jgi:uncharacterized membrane protein YfcA
MLDRDAVVRALLLTPVVLAGSWFGARAFRKADPEKARQWTLLVLLAIGLALLVRVFAAA